MLKHDYKIAMEERASVESKFDVIQLMDDYAQLRSQFRLVLDTCSDENDPDIDFVDILPDLDQEEATRNYKLN